LYLLVSAYEEQHKKYLLILST